MSKNQRAFQQEPWKFEGFAFPTTTPVPDQLFDELLYHLSPTEIVVLLYIIRRTFGFKKRSDNISLKQLCEGITTSDGKVLDQGTGLSKATVARALNSLEDKNVINRIRRSSRKKGDQPTTFELNFLMPVSQIETPRVSSARHPVSHPRDTQQTVKQQTDSVVVNGLIERGITKKVARQLAAEYAAEHIIYKMEFFDALVETESGLISRNPAGYLLKAITEDYQAPKWFKSKAEREAQAEENERIRMEIDAQRKEEERQLEKEKQRVVEKYDIEPELVATWDDALAELRGAFSRPYYEKWLQRSHLLSVGGQVAKIGVQTDEAQAWLNDRARAVVSRVLTGLLGENADVEFETIELEDGG